MLVLDHIVVSAQSLSAGRAHVEGLLGVSLQTGGRHALMGTHNLLLGLENGLYLEVIAIDPKAPDPQRARWLGLDVFRGPPKVTNWVGRSDNLVLDMKVLFGEGTAPTRLTRGDLQWDMSVIDAGQTPYDGLVPMMLDWGGGPKAADRLEPSGCRLRKMILGHPDAGGLADRLSGILNTPLVSIETRDSACFEVLIETPNGEVILR